MTMKLQNLFKAGFHAPLLVIVLGVMLSLLYRVLNLPIVWGDTIPVIATVCLSVLALVSGVQFRISQLARVCPVSFRLCFGGAPLFLIVCGLVAFILIPQISIAPAFLLGGILMLNGSAFDRRSVISAPAPALVKAGVRLESAVVLVLGLPIVVLLEGAASSAFQGQGALYPLLEASRMLALSFAIGGFGGLFVAVAGNRYFMNYGVGICVIGAAVAMMVAYWMGGQTVIAAAAFGLIWGEQSMARPVSRLKLRVRMEQIVIPLGYLMFGFVFAQRLFEVEFLMVTYAVAAVTIVRAVPRLLALQKSVLEKEGQMFLAWFGGTPGAASALYLLSILDHGNIRDQELILTVGAVCILMGVFTARLTSRPLAKNYIRAMASSHRRKLLG